MWVYQVPFMNDAHEIMILRGMLFQSLCKRCVTDWIRDNSTTVWTVSGWAVSVSVWTVSSKNEPNPKIPKRRYTKHGQFHGRNSQRIFKMYWAWVYTYSTVGECNTNGSPLKNPSCTKVDVHVANGDRFDVQKSRRIVAIPVNIVCILLHEAARVGVSNNTCTHSKSCIPASARNVL